MAKYVCDFGTVTSMGQKLCSSATEVSNAVNNYNSTIESDLSSWSGEAKSSFEETNEAQVAKTKKDVSQMNQLGEYIQKASKAIETLENELAALKI